LKKKHRLRAFKNKVLRKTFWIKMDKLIGERRRLYNEELYEL
jgi:hypothetical protein